ncbi:type 1 fimbrial protein [Intestinirhabdus alba]|jgi:type 1 fimbria pilin|uniref:Type 1 fimbrial protein n=1 Tax=Intestinirhabdus alba TaxID=2899544 RepID=A0A6L6ILW8_9ENTR|nr:type 1 fimbrial protein [Intestinirhabdus alba]MTH46586.1 type 1 fimbrial protein [Intestinirhabdus alba]
MNISISKFALSVGLCTSALWPIFVCAQQPVQSGVVHFMGQIIEDPCEVKLQYEQIAMSCPRNGRMQSNYFPLHQVAKASQQFQQISSVNMSYLNQDKTLAIMKIDYH